MHTTYSIIDPLDDIKHSYNETPNHEYYTDILIAIASVNGSTNTGGYKTTIIINDSINAFPAIVIIHKSFRE